MGDTQQTMQWWNPWWKGRAADLEDWLAECREERDSLRARLEIAEDGKNHIQQVLGALYGPNWKDLSVATARQCREFNETMSQRLLVAERLSDAVKVAGEIGFTMIELCLAPDGRKLCTVTRENDHAPGNFTHKSEYAETYEAALISAVEQAQKLDD